MENGEPPREEGDGPEITAPKAWATGFPAVRSSVQHAWQQAGVVRGFEALRRVNQAGGFDCPSCAWPDPEDRSRAEFCENGAKAVASEATRRVIGREFFARYSVSDLLQKSDAWHEQQGRLGEPMVRRKESDRYEPIGWEEAFELLAAELRSLDSPDEAVFYTSGRTSNEAAFLYQLMVRMFGTNNLPDCSNMCHESSGAALGRAIGVGKGTVQLGDFAMADCIVCIGQNPGTNHPRMLSALETAAEHGARILAVNPLKEAGLLAFAHPQKLGGLLGRSTPLASQYLQVRVNGDHALLRMVAKCWLEWEEGGEAVFDRGFLAEHTVGSEAYLDAVRASDGERLLAECGLERSEVERFARTLLRGERRVITCWAMGLTQHRNAVATIREIANLHLLIGAIGRRGAGLCPVRGHSNVQGDRTMGIFEKMPESFHEALDEVCGFKSPRKHGYDTVQAIQAMHRGEARVFMGMGGNFLQAAPDTARTAAALQRCTLTCQVSTKLNRSHLVTGKVGLILPCLGRSDRDVGLHGLQIVSTENSMGIVQGSTGRLEPVSADLRSEPAIVAGLAAALLGDRGRVRWEWLAEDYDRIRDLIEAVVPGFADFNRRLREPGGFVLPNGARERNWQTPEGRAVFSAGPVETMRVGPGRLILQTLRSHDQFNTTIYGMGDRYRGIGNGRRIVFLNPEDMLERGLKPAVMVDLTSHWNGETRVAREFRAIPYDIPRGCAAAYFPEANVLVPVEDTAAISNTPASKGVEVSVAASVEG